MAGCSNGCENGQIDGWWMDAAMDVKIDRWNQSMDAVIDVKMGRYMKQWTEARIWFDYIIDCPATWLMG